MEVLEKHTGMFAGALGKIKATENRRDLYPDTKKISQQPYRTVPKSSEVLEQSIQTQLDAGIVELALTEWDSSGILAPKRDGTMRFCVDFRRLNAAKTADNYPVPRMEDCIESFRDAKIFSMCRGDTVSCRSRTSVIVHLYVFLVIL